MDSPAPHLPDRRIAIAQLPAPAFQMFINWISSRIRSIGVTWALRMGELSADDKVRFRKGIDGELGSALGLLGIGVALHAELIHPPPVLTKMVRLAVNDTIHDFNSVVHIVQDTLEAKEDPHLMYYGGNWWSEFSPGKPTPSVEISELYDWWAEQRAICPKPLMLPQFTGFNLSHMVAGELEAVHGVLKQMRRDIKLDIEATQQEITRATLCIAKTKLHILSLKSREEQAIEGELAKYNVSSAATGEGRPR